MQRKVPENLADRFEDSSEYVDVDFHTEFRCKKCGWKPDESFGCIIAMEKHMRDEHGIVPNDGFVFWIDSPTETDIRKGLEMLYEKDRT